MEVWAPKADERGARTEWPACMIRGQYYKPVLWLRLWDYQSRVLMACWARRCLEAVTKEEEDVVVLSRELAAQLASQVWEQASSDGTVEFDCRQASTK